MFVELVGFGGGGVLGGDPFENRWQSRLDGFWMQGGDVRISSIESKIVPGPSPVPTAEETRKQEAELKKLHSADVVARRIQQAADSESSSFIERLPWVPSNVGESTPDAPYNKPLSKLFARLNDLHYHHKWRNGILLVSRFSWINADQDAMVLPYSLLQKVWHLRDDPRPSLEDLVILAAALSPEQLRGLIDDNNPGLVTVYANMPILGPLSRVSPAIREQMRQQQEGVPCAELPAALRSALKIDSRYDGAVRVRESEGPPADSSDGRIFHYFSFIGLPASDTSGHRPTLRSFIGYEIPPTASK